jgi:hypothetical protein
MSTGIAAIYVDSSHFKVSGDKRGDLRPTRILRLMQGIGGTAEVDVVSASFTEGSGYTVCEVSPALVVETLAEFHAGPTYADGVGLSGNLASHPHYDRYTGGYIPRLPDPRAEPTWAKRFVRVADNPADGYSLFDLLGAANDLIGMNVDGTDVVSRTLEGTENQIDIDFDQPGKIILALPQNIDETASPTFAGLTLTGLTGLLEAKGSTAVGVITGDGALKVFRRNVTNTGYEFAELNLSDLTGDIDFDSLAEGDLIYRNASSKWVNLAKGDVGKFLRMGAALPSWSDAALKDLSDIADAVSDSGVAGDIMLRGASVYDRLPKGTLLGDNLSIDASGNVVWTAPLFVRSDILGGETIAQYAVVYTDSAAAGKWKKAKTGGTDDEKTPWGMVVKSGGLTNGVAGEVVIHGLVTNAGWSWTPGKILWLDSTYGAMTETKPVTNAIQLARAITATIIYFAPGGQGSGEGASGPFTPAGEWLDDTDYVVNNAVDLLGSSYWCHVAHHSGATTKPDDGADWRTKWGRIASKGATGGPIYSGFTTITVSATEPVAPAEGDLWIDTGA